MMQEQGNEFGNSAVDGVGGVDGAHHNRIRLWPGLLILILQVVAFWISIEPSINNAARFGFMVGAPVLCGLLLIIWLLTASRLSWGEKITLLLVPIGLSAIVAQLIHSTLGVMMIAHGIPLTILVVVVGLYVIRAGDRSVVRTVPILLCLGIVWAVFPLVRVDGVDGQYLPELAWRWSDTRESQLDSLRPLTATKPVDADPVAGIAPAVDSLWVPTEQAWPGFRGPDRNGRVSSSLSAPMMWRERTPAAKWRVPIGPGWSSFASVGGRLFTQEQRGDRELVTCYDGASGDMIWHHADETRFDEVVSGAGPRATPTFSDGRISSFGSRAMLNCLDAGTGALVWQRDLMTEFGAQLPVWGFCSSPLVTDGLVVVYAGGRDDHGIVAFAADSGEPRWKVASGGMNFSSLQSVTLAGQSMLVFGDGSGLIGLVPGTGEVAWRYKPEDWAGPAVCQPQQIESDSLLAALGDGKGMVRLDVSFSDGQWSFVERWSTAKLKPSFNDFVYHEGHVYGFDQSILACLDADTGERKWKGGRYGFGQMVLLSEIGQLLVTGEHGELVLINASPDGLDEQGRFEVLSGKTWNHPVVVRDQLFIRNGAEAVCLDLG
ncbi:MAG: PQQ-binding-like beta-propeller repeat protein [Phycisphaerae bacterium]